MSLLALPVGLVLQEASLPRLAYDERVLSPRWTPGVEHVYRFGTQWVGDSVVRACGVTNRAAGYAIAAVLNALQSAGQWAEWPLKLPTVDATLPGSLVLNSTATVLQSDGRIKLVFSTLTAAQRNAKLPLGTFLRWGGRTYQVAGHVASNANTYLIPGIVPAKVSNAFPVLVASRTIKARLSQVEHPRGRGFIGPWSVAWREWTG